jgi:hypothetical protein
MQTEGITEALAPLIVRKRVERYRPYQVYRRRSPRNIPLPDSPIPSRPASPIPASSSSYHTASPGFPPLEPGEIRCLGCGENGHLMERCDHDYVWDATVDRYVAIPHGKQVERQFNTGAYLDEFPKRTTIWDKKKSRKSSA